MPGGLRRRMYDIIYRMSDPRWTRGVILDRHDVVVYRQSCRAKQVLALACEKLTSPRTEVLPTSDISPVLVVWWLYTDNDQLKEASRNGAVNIPLCREWNSLRETRRQVTSTLWSLKTRRSVLTSTNALPDIDTFSPWVPYTTLGVDCPLNIAFPDTSGVTDETWHDMGEGRRVWSGWSGGFGEWLEE